MTSFELPATARPGDRLPDVRLLLASGERVRLHSAFAGTALQVAFAPGADIREFAPPSHNCRGLWITAAPAEAPHGWENAVADAEWCGLLPAGTVVLTDANLRVVEPAATDAVPSGPSQPVDPAVTRDCAPVLQVADVLEPALCRALIEHFATDCAGGQPSKVLVLENGKQEAILAPEIKARRESPIRDPALEAAVHARLHRRLVPEIARVFQFAVARRDPFKLLGYAPDAGYFRPHRDNDTADVAYRRFAISINLNASEYAGGDFRFPEFGQHRYSPATGAALIFSCSLLHEVLPVQSGTRHAVTTFVA